MKQGYIEKSFSPSKSDLEKISEYTRREFDESELFVFGVVLCDNEIDRDFEKFSKSALDELAILFKGKTGIFDHCAKSSNQSARIFETCVEKADGKKTTDGEDYYCLKARAYMVRTADNESLIKEIDAGIKKEVSVSCSLADSRCSICGKTRKSGECKHIKGKTYGNKLCTFTLFDATDAYEWSFVAVPAQRNAGVTKSFSGKESTMDDIKKNLEQVNENLVLTKKEANKLSAYITELECEAELGKEYKNSLVNEVTKLCALSIPEIDSEMFRGVAQSMNSDELLSFKSALSKRASKIMPVELQLSHEKNREPKDNSQFKI